MADEVTRETVAEVADQVTDEVGTGEDGLWVGDAIRFFLDAKRAGGRSERTIDDYRKKLELFQRWVAERYGASRETDEVDAPYVYIGPDEVEAYVVYLKDGRSIAESSRKNHLAVLRSFFQTVSRRLEVPDPTAKLDEVRFHQKVPKRSYLTKREADLLLSAIASQVTNTASDPDQGFRFVTPRVRPWPPPWPRETTPRSRP